MAIVVRTCSACGRGNRVQAVDLAKTSRCGACKALLDPLNEPVDADSELFEEVIANSRVPVLVDFWAAWCAPCRMAAPEVARVAREMAGRAIVLKVDTDQHQALSARYGVRGIPNFIVFRRGSVAMQQAGVVPADQMKRWLEQTPAGA